MRCRLVWVVLLLSAWVAGAARAEQTAVSPREVWSQATAAVDGGDLDGAAKKTSDLIDLGKNNGIKTYPLYAESAAAFARDSLKNNNKAGFDWGTKTAEQLDPTSSDVAFSRADAAADQKQWGAAASALFSGFTRIFANHRSTVLSRADLAIVLVLALALTGIVFGVALFIRYGRSMAHDFREILGRRFHGGSVTVLAFALLFLPLFIWLGPMWLIFYWLIIFFGYADWSERSLIIILALLIAAAPIVLDLSAHWIAGVDSTPVAAAISTGEQRYHPENLRRMQELIAIVPDNPTLHLLLGNLQLQEGNEQLATSEYQRSTQVRDTAGAHVNLGNLRFLNNDLGSATTEYQKAQALDPHLAIAFYNDSVASGDMYKFEEQSRKLDAAKHLDRAFVERLLSKPPAQKIVMYNPPISEAWSLADSLADSGKSRALFGNYSSFDPVVSAINPITIGSLVTVVFAFLLWMKRKRNGFAGSCIKCGRTFCHRCKSSRESATYCTQCIHIYLKRDGVSLDTKRTKLDEVQQHISSLTWRNRVFATFLPGSAQLLEGRTITGTFGLYLFLLFVSLALLAGRLAPVLAPGQVAVMALRAVAVALALILWCTMSLPVYRRRFVV